MGGAFRFDNGVTPPVMRTEGVIKVGLMMEGGIFDFDRQCGSCSRASLAVFRFVYAFYFILIHKT